MVSHHARCACLSCSLGVNLGEAVNFAAPDWLRFGAAALGRLRHFRKPCVVSQEEMLLRVARQQAGPRAAAALGALAPRLGSPPAGSPPASPPASPGTPSAIVCYYLRQELQRVVEEEWVLRAHLWSQGGRRRVVQEVQRRGWLGCCTGSHGVA